MSLVLKNLDFVNLSLPGQLYHVMAVVPNLQFFSRISNEKKQGSACFKKCAESGFTFHLLIYIFGGEHMVPISI